MSEEATDTSTRGQGEHHPAEQGMYSVNDDTRALCMLSIGVDHERSRIGYR